MSAVWGPSDRGMEGLGSPHGNSGFRFGVEIGFLKRAKKQLPSPVMGTTYDFPPPSCLGTLHRPHIILKPVLVPQHHVVGFCHVRPLLGPHRYPRGEVNCQPGDPMGSPLTEFEIAIFEANSFSLENSYRRRYFLRAWFGLKSYRARISCQTSEWPKQPQSSSACPRHGLFKAYFNFPTP